MSFNDKSLKLAFDQNKGNTLTAEMNGKVVVLAKNSEQGNLTMDGTLFANLTEKEDKQFMLNAFKSAQETVKKDEEHQLALKNKGVNQFLISYREAEVRMQNFRNKSDELEENPFGRLAVALSDCAKCVGSYIAHNHAFESLGKAFNDIKDLATDVKFVANTCEDEKTKPLMRQLLSNKIKDAVNTFIPKWKDITKVFTPSIGGINDKLTRWDELNTEEIDRKIENLTKETRESTGLDEVIDIANEVSVNVGAMDYKTFKACENVIDTVGGRNELYIVSEPIFYQEGVSREELMTFQTNEAMKVFPEAYEQIYENITGSKGVQDTNKTTVLTGISAEKSAMYEEPIFKATCINKNGTEFNMVFAPTLDMIQLTKKDIDKGTGEVLFNNTNTKHLDLSAVLNGETKAFIKEAPVVGKSIDNYTHGKGREVTQPIQQRNQPTQA